MWRRLERWELSAQAMLVFARFELGMEWLSPQFTHSKDGKCNSSGQRYGGHAVFGRVANMDVYKRDDVAALRCRGDSPEYQLFGKLHEMRIDPSTKRGSSQRSSVN